MIIDHCNHQGTVDPVKARPRAPGCQPGGYHYEDTTFIVMKVVCIVSTRFEQAAQHASAAAACTAEAAHRRASLEEACLDVFPGSSSNTPLFADPARTRLFLRIQLEHAAFRGFSTPAPFGCGGVALCACAGRRGPFRECRSVGPIGPGRAGLLPIRACAIRVGPASCRPAGEARQVAEPAAPSSLPSRAGGGPVVCKMGRNGVLRKNRPRPIRKTTQKRPDGFAPVRPLRRPGPPESRRRCASLRPAESQRRRDGRAGPGRAGRRPLPRRRGKPWPSGGCCRGAEAVPESRYGREVPMRSPRRRRIFGARKAWTLLEGSYQKALRIIIVSIHRSTWRGAHLSQLGETILRQTRTRSLRKGRLTSGSALLP